MTVKINISEGELRNEPAYDLNQIDLISAISEEVSRQYPGIKTEPRLFNAIVAAADSLVAAFAEPRKDAVPGMGLSMWLRSDDVGASSKYMAWLMNKDKFLMPDFSVPIDVSDFSRCVKMVDAIGFTDEQVSSSLRNEAVGYWRLMGSDWISLRKLHDGGATVELAYELAMLKETLS